jgi:hypothetical protein
MGVEVFEANAGWSTRRLQFCIPTGIVTTHNIPDILATDGSGHTPHIDTARTGQKCPLHGNDHTEKIAAEMFNDRSHNIGSGWKIVFTLSSQLEESRNHREEYLEKPMLALCSRMERIGFAEKVPQPTKLHMQQKLAPGEPRYAIQSTSNAVLEHIAWICLGTIKYH